MVQALKRLKLKKDSALWTGLLTHKIVRDALNLIQGISPLSFIDLRTASIYFRFVTQLKTLTQLCFQPACHPVKSTRMAIEIFQKHLVATSSEICQQK